jgi:sugar phosphate isomerase/epimerase
MQETAMQLGFVSAILGDLTLEEVLHFAAEEGFGCVELMCWPPSKAERRYAGVTHLDVTSFGDSQAQQTLALVRKHGVAISGLGYYPNPLDPDPGHRRMVIDHLKKVIAAAPKVGVGVVNTFIGRDWTKNIEANLGLFREVWPEIIRHAETQGVKVAIENCPMLFSNDEWPGGKNLAISPAVWRAMFEAIPSPHFGLNFDPSHLVWQHIDYVRCIRDFGKRIHHFHAKDARIDADALYDRGILGLNWHTPKIPGLGDVNWGAVFSALTDASYNGPVCIEVEDRAFEKSLEDRKRSLRQSKRFLEQFVA